VLCSQENWPLQNALCFSCNWGAAIVFISEEKMPAIETSVLKGTVYQNIVSDVFGDIFGPLPNVNVRDIDDLKEYQGVPYGPESDSAHRAYVVALNTDFFLTTDRGYLGVFHYSHDKDYIVHLIDGYSIEFLGDTGSNWAPHLLNDFYQSKIDEFREKCRHQLGIDDSEFDRYEARNMKSWIPIRQ
jgi:hypothetical protein